MAKLSSFHKQQEMRAAFDDMLCFLSLSQILTLISVSCEISSDNSAGISILRSVCFI